MPATRTRNSRFIPHAVGIGSFNRVPSGPRQLRPGGRIPTRGALPTRLNECAILNRAAYGKRVVALLTSRRELECEPAERRRLSLPLIHPVDHCHTVAGKLVHLWQQFCRLRQCDSIADQQVGP